MLKTVRPENNRSSRELNDAKIVSRNERSSRRNKDRNSGGSDKRSGRSSGSQSRINRKISSVRNIYGRCRNNTAGKIKSGLSSNALNRNVKDNRDSSNSNRGSRSKTGSLNGIGRGSGNSKDAVMTGNANATRSSNYSVGRHRNAAPNNCGMNSRDKITGKHKGAIGGVMNDVRRSREILTNANGNKSAGFVNRSIIRDIVSSSAYLNNVKEFCSSSVASRNIVINRDI